MVLVLPLISSVLLGKNLTSLNPSSWNKKFLSCLPHRGSHHSQVFCDPPRVQGSVQQWAGQTISAHTDFTVQSGQQKVNK